MTEGTGATDPGAGPPRRGTRGRRQGCTDTPGYPRGMPNAPKTQHRSVRFDDDTWSRLADGAKATGTDRTGVLKQLTDLYLRLTDAATAAGTDPVRVLEELTAWYLHEPGAKLPQRPSPQQQGT